MMCLYSIINKRFWQVDFAEIFSKKRANMYFYGFYMRNAEHTYFLKKLHF